MKPTLYHLIFKRNVIGEYDVYERHSCQEKGCFKTEPKFVSTCLPNHIDEFVEEYEEALLEGIVDEVEVVE